MSAQHPLLDGLCDGLTASDTPTFPGFPERGNASGNGQSIEPKGISRISRISRTPETGSRKSSREAPPARVRADAGARARGDCANEREIREQREMPAGSTGYISRSLSIKTGKREIERNNPALASRSLPEPPTFEERAAFLEYECGLSRAEAEDQARAECEPPTAELASSRVILPQADGLALWRTGLALIGPHRAPCPGYRGDEWSRVHRRALAFLDTYGVQAEALGWTAPRLFGVHPSVGIVRVDACGALVLPAGGNVRALTATEISFGHLTHREKPGQPEGVPVWDIAQ